MLRCFGRGAFFRLGIYTNDRKGYNNNRKKMQQENITGEHIR